MVWLVVGGIGVLVVFAAACVWAVAALLEEVGEGQDSLSDHAELDSTNDPKKGHSRVYRH
jgi:hypothetical protein